MIENIPKIVHRDVLVQSVRQSVFQIVVFYDEPLDSYFIKLIFNQPFYKRMIIQSDKEPTDMEGTIVDGNPEDDLNGIFIILFIKFIYFSYFKRPHNNNIYNYYKMLIYLVFKK